MMANNPRKRIEGELIDLRKPNEDDLEPYLAFLQDPEMNRLTGSSRPFSKNEIAEWLRKISADRDDRADFIIASRETGELLGEVVLNEYDEEIRSANIRIGIQGDGNRGRGYGTEAMKLMLAYGFETIKLHKIHLGVYVFNPRAVRVYEKLGFRRDGVERHALLRDGEYIDMILMSMLEDEFRALYAKK